MGGVGLTMSGGLISYAETFSHGGGEAQSDHTLFLSRHRHCPLSNSSHAFLSHFLFLHLTGNHYVCMQRKGGGGVTRDKRKCAIKKTPLNLSGLDFDLGRRIFC